MTDFPDLKIKVVPTFPSNIIGGTGLSATKSNGSLTLDYAWQEFGSISSIPTSPTSYILTYDTLSNAYVMVPSHLLGGAVAGISEAPIDGTLYGRQSATWVNIPAGNPGTAPPLMNGTATVGTSLLYSRQDHVHPSDTSRLSDAPVDGSSYGRLNGAWAKTLPLAGGTLTGPLILNADPSAALGAATKQYVDTHVGGGGSFDTLSPTTTRGDIIYRNAATNTRLGAAAAGYLLQTNGAGADPSWAGFNQNTSGAVVRTWQAKAADVVCVKDFGAVGDGITDDTAAMNRAHATNHVIFYPTGTYIFSVLNPIGAGGIIGEGRQATLLSSTDTGTSSLITFNNSIATPIFRDFSLIAPSSGNLPIKTSGGGIHFTPAGGEIAYAHFDNVTVAFCPYCVYLGAASYWTINNCEFLGYSKAGLTVDNTNNPDSGDGVIQGCLFNTPGTSGIGIEQHASGGLKIESCKFLSGANGYVLNFNGSNSTSDLLISNCSFENMSGQDIALSRVAGSFKFTNIIICGCQFAVGQTGIQTDGSNFLAEMSISGCTFNLASGSGYGINLATVANFNISGCVFRGNGGSPAGIVIGSSCVNGKVGSNTYSALAATISNFSSSTFVQKDTQQGISVTPSSGWSSFGSLFNSPAVNVTFPVPFSVSPTNADIMLIAGSTNGVVSGILISSSTTGFTYIALSVSNNIAATMEWKAFGVI